MLVLLVLFVLVVTFVNLAVLVLVGVITQVITTVLVPILGVVTRRAGRMISIIPANQLNLGTPVIAAVAVVVVIVVIVVVRAKFSVRHRCNDLEVISGSLMNFPVAFSIPIHQMALSNKHLLLFEDL